MKDEKFGYYYENIEALDFIFHNLPFSVSQTDKSSVQTSIAGIAADAVVINSCTSIGRIFFQEKGEIVLEAEIYFGGPACNYFLFYEQGEKKYANMMAPSAVNFYQQLISQVQNTTPSQ